MNTVNKNVDICVRNCQMQEINKSLKNSLKNDDIQKKKDLKI